MRWTDIYEIAMALEESYPEEDIMYISFPDLHDKVLDLEGFSGDPKHSNEKILEAIQTAWLEERD
jgi:FeS assembly protein IscX